VTVNVSISTTPSKTNPQTVWWTQLLIDNVSVASGYNTLTWDSTTVADGPHQLTVKAYPYNSSSVLSSASIPITVGN